MLSNGVLPCIEDMAREKACHIGAGLDRTDTMSDLGVEGTAGAPLCNQAERLASLPLHY